MVMPRPVPPLITAIVGRNANPALLPAVSQIDTADKVWDIRQLVLRGGG